VDAERTCDVEQVKRDVRAPGYRGRLTLDTALDAIDFLEAERDQARKDAERLAEAMSDPFLVILESHPNADQVANAEMSRAAKRFRDILAAYRSEQE
jgi:hypothetical protein